MILGSYAFFILLNSSFVSLYCITCDVALMLSISIASISSFLQYCVISSGVFSISFFMILFLIIGPAFSSISFSLSGLFSSIIGNSSFSFVISPSNSCSVSFIIIPSFDSATYLFSNLVDIACRSIKINKSVYNSCFIPFVDAPIE